MNCVAVGFRCGTPGTGGYQCWIKGIAAGFTPVAGDDCATVINVSSATATGGPGISQTASVTVCC